MYSGLNCWAATYEGTSCVLYYTSDPWLFTDPVNIDASSKQLFLKDCYISKIIYTFKTHGLAYSPFLNLEVLGAIFRFTQSNKNYIQANSEDPDQTPHYAVSDLGLHCLPKSYK